MAAYLIDTNVLVRAADPEAAKHSVADLAMQRLLSEGQPCFLTPQVIVEFWAVATRPRPANGLGWTSAQTKDATDRLLRQIPLLEETPRIFPHWLSLVAAQGIVGKRVHDARLVAVMQAHQVTHLLTFNTADFPTSFGVVALSPEEVA